MHKSPNNLPSATPTSIDSISKASSKLSRRTDRPRGRCLAPGGTRTDRCTNRRTTCPQPLPPASTPSAKPAASYPDGLTAREVDVLRLVAQGLTDAQIAEQLVLSHSHQHRLHQQSQQQAIPTD